MSWEKAHEIAPGASLTVIEITNEEAENGGWLDDVEDDEHKGCQNDSPNG